MSRSVDGKALQPPYKVPAYDGPEPTGGPADAKVYHGSCHCGAVTLALRFKDLDTLDKTVDTDRIMTCNCSMCQRVSNSVPSLSDLSDLFVLVQSFCSISMGERARDRWRRQRERERERERETDRDG